MTEPRPAPEPAPATDPVPGPEPAPEPGTAPAARATSLGPRPPLGRPSPAETAPSAEREPPAGREPSAGREPPAGREPSAKREPSARRARFRIRGAAVRRRAVDLVAAAVSLATTVVVAILAAHIVFTAFEANPGNEIVRWAGARAHGLAWEFKDVFQPSNAKAEIAVNYGLAGLVYLLAGRAAVGALRRLR
ncbi:hypothetical protein [Actinomadura sp. NEAU-AAG7]|uniref:hypothetical protein n=1 Tax=Actinomadura sp. NEAU-AAG7 TaxID=2839640 RepID=UPI001BE3F9EA|nr:hypothetical protein [Actinomadura sp. NEAU-AAG7]MBT2213076.1 hypothetical protein [Actinomadura sp. NEAU-AAG7]